jgi:hypothetical protein
MSPEAVPSPAAELERLLAEHDPAVVSLALRLRALVLEEAPAARELVYDSPNAVSVAFTFTGRLAGAFCHVAVYARHVNLGFNRGSELPDPTGLLEGSGKRIRHLGVREPADLERPHLRHFLRLAAARAPTA